MIDLACGMIKMSKKRSYIEISDQEGKLNLTSLVMILYHLISGLSLELICYNSYKYKVITKLPISHTIQLVL